MKKMYIAPVLEFDDMELDNLMGNMFSDPNTGKVPDDPTDVKTPGVSLDDDEEDDPSKVNSKDGFLNFDFTLE